MTKFAIWVLLRAIFGIILLDTMFSVLINHSLDQIFGVNVFNYDIVLMFFMFVIGVYIVVSSFNDLWNGFDLSRKSKVDYLRKEYLIIVGYQFITGLIFLLFGELLAFVLIDYEVIDIVVDYFIVANYFPVALSVVGYIFIGSGVGLTYLIINAKREFSQKDYNKKLYRKKYNIA